jgi:hypothetical protein
LAPEDAAPARCYDFKVGIGHIRHWERIALVTDIDWIGARMKVFSFPMPGDVRLFPLSAADRAREWIASADMPARICQLASQQCGASSSNRTQAL